MEGSKLNICRFRLVNHSHIVINYYTIRSLKCFEGRVLELLIQGPWIDMGKRFFLNP